LRSPGRAEAEPKCLAALGALFDKHALGRPGDVEVDRTGWVNICMFVDDVVVRFNARDPHLPKFRRECIAYRELGIRDFPVPEVLALDEDRDVCPYDVLVTNRLPGRNLELDWASLELEQLHDLTDQAARWLDRIHHVTFIGFGEIAEGTPCTSWGQAVATQMAFHLAEARELETFSPRDVAAFEALFDVAAPFFDDIEVPALVHSDYHPGNILYADTTITGLLDFEWCFAGDPAFDLAYQQNLDGMGFPETFVESFGPVLDERALFRQQLYQCMRNVELSNIARRHFEAGEAERYRDVTLAHLDLVDR